MIVRVVIDSNVIISGLLFDGPPARIMECALRGRIECFTSLPILDEVREVFQRPKFGLSPDQALSLIEELHDLCVIVSLGRRIRAVDADPDDNAILECAVPAGVELVISGDSHLLDLGRWRRIRILSPSDALKEIEGQHNAGSYF